MKASKREPAADLLDGTAYRPIRVLGIGGHGEVYEALHVELDRPVVVKLLLQELGEDPRMLERFRLEAQSLARLRNPHVVNVTDMGRTAAGRPYFVMQKLEGCTLSDELRRRGKVTVFEALDWVIQALRGLEAVHETGIVHRDIKPSNLFIAGPPRSKRTVMILDFGVAKVVDVVRSQVAPPIYPTEEGVVIGTPKFLSPEQAFGKAVDHRSDLYAIGLVLYLLLAGRGPFDDLRRDVTLVAAHAKLEPPPPSQFATEPIPIELDRATLKALAKRPGDRCQSAAEFIAELEAVVELLHGPSGSLETITFDRSLFKNASPADLIPAVGSIDVTDPDVPPTAVPGAGDASGGTLRLPDASITVPQHRMATTHTKVEPVVAEDPASQEVRTTRQARSRDMSLIVVIVVTALVIAGLAVVGFAVLFPS